MIKATVKLLPEEAEALATYLHARAGEHDRTTHLGRALGYVAGAIEHEIARAGVLR